MGFVICSLLPAFPAISLVLPVKLLLTTPDKGNEEGSHRVPGFLPKSAGLAVPMNLGEG